VIGIEEAAFDPSLTPSNVPSNAGASSEQPLETGGNSGSNPGGAAAGEDVGSGGASPTTAGTGGNVSAGGLTGQGGEPAAEASLCERYCTAVTENCTESFAVYTSYDACIAVCSALPEGAPGDRDVDTVHCRLHAAANAPDEVPFYCPIAGPGGNGSCGSNCESLCKLRDKVCSNWVSTDNAACMASCAKLPDLGSYTTALPDKQYQGPHVQCRLYHISAAATDDPEGHCQHVEGNTPCK